MAPGGPNHLAGKAWLFWSLRPFASIYYSLQLGSNAPKQVFLYLFYRRGNRCTYVTCFAWTEHAGNTQFSGVPILRLSRTTPFQPESSSFTTAFLPPLPFSNHHQLSKPNALQRAVLRKHLKSNHEELKTFLPGSHFILHGKRAKQQANSGNRSPGQGYKKLDEEVAYRLQWEIKRR